MNDFQEYLVEGEIKDNLNVKESKKFIMDLKGEYDIQHGIIMEAIESLLDTAEIAENAVFGFEHVLLKSFDDSIKIAVNDFLGEELDEIRDIQEFENETEWERNGFKDEQDFWNYKEGVQK